MLEIRRARPEDKESVREIYASAVGREASLDGARLDGLVAEGALLVAEGADGVVGFGSMEAAAAWNIRWLYILPGHQGAGVGSALLGQLEGLGWRAGLNSIRLHATPGAVGFYRRHGYREVSHDEGAGHDHEGVLMMKERSR